MGNHPLPRGVRWAVRLMRFFAKALNGIAIVVMASSFLGILASCLNDRSSLWGWQIEFVAAGLILLLGNVVLVFAEGVKLAHGVVVSGTPDDRPELRWLRFAKGALEVAGVLLFFLTAASALLVVLRCIRKEPATVEIVCTVVPLLTAIVVGCCEKFVSTRIEKI